MVELPREVVVYYEAEGFGSVWSAERVGGDGSVDSINSHRYACARSLLDGHPERNVKRS